MTGRGARQECVSNNVDWYRSVARAHGLEGAIEHGVWTCRSSMPPYHSNAVTVSPSGMEAQVSHVRDLVEAVGHPFTVKDSHAHLDLAPLGFRSLFDAEWIRLEHDALTHAGGLPATGWRRLTTPEELVRFEDGWRAHGSPATTRVFLPALLADESVAFLTVEREGAILAGVVANRSPHVVGLSNFFAAGPEVDAQLAGAVAAVRRSSPGAAVVGYESGESLARARRAGFRAVGALRIWVLER